MIKRFDTLTESEQIEIMNLIREWKTTEEGIKTIPLVSDNSSLIGRGSTPKTYIDLMKLRYKNITEFMRDQVFFKDYVVYNYKNEPVGVIGYSYVDNKRPNTNTVASGLYVIQFNPDVGGFILLKSLYIVQDEMIKNHNEICFNSTRYDDPNKRSAFDYDVTERFVDKLLSTNEYEFVDISGSKHIGKYIVLMK